MSIPREIQIDGVKFVQERITPANKVSFGRCLKNCRRGRQWSLDEAAEKIGVSKTYLFELENGKSVEPSFRIAARIAMIYCIDLLYLSRSLDVVDTGELMDI